MGFPTIDLAAIKSQLKQGFDANGNDATFTLVSGGSFTIKAFDGYRSTSNITEGIQMETHRLKVLASDWDSNAAQPPGRGDRVEYMGSTYAIQTGRRVRGIQGDSLMYVMEIRG